MPLRIRFWRKQRKLPNSAVCLKIHGKGLSTQKGRIDAVIELAKAASAGYFPKLSLVESPADAASTTETGQQVASKRPTARERARALENSVAQMEERNPLTEGETQELYREMIKASSWRMRLALIRQLSH